MNTYSEAFKAQMVKKMLPPASKSAHALAAETGLNQSSLSRWLRDARSVGVMNQPTKEWTAAEKLRVVVESAQLDDAALGVLLRREGLHKVQLDAWRSAVEGALSASPTSASSKKKASQESKRIAALERELRRKDKALAEAAALLVRQKKVQELWGDADDVMSARSEK